MTSTRRPGLRELSPARMTYPARRRSTASIYWSSRKDRRATSISGPRISSRRGVEWSAQSASAEALLLFRCSQPNTEPAPKRFRLPRLDLFLLAGQDHQAKQTSNTLYPHGGRSIYNPPERMSSPRRSYTSGPIRSRKPTTFPRISENGIRT